MSLRTKDQVLLPAINDRQIAYLIALALRLEHAETDAVVKRISRVTGASIQTVRKWYEGQNAPSAANLLILMGAYETVLQAMLRAAGLEELLDRPKGGVSPSFLGTPQEVYGDKFVTINVLLQAKNADQFNQRQLWFLGELQRNRPLKTTDITKIWGVTLRTAKRDVAALVTLKVIKYLGAQKNGHYAFVPLPR